MENALQKFAEQGVLGMVVAVLGFAVWRLYGRLEEISEKRLGESRETISAMHNMADALNANTRVMSALMDTIRSNIRNRDE